MATRGYGRGSIYQRSDGLWVGATSVGTGRQRRRKVFTNVQRETVEERMDRWLRDNPRPACDPGTRTSHMRRARSLDTHTGEEWAAKVQAAAGVCHYCRRSTDRPTKDHIIPVSRGGSDGIDNLAPACWDCNYEKRNMTGQEFMAHAELTDFFDKPRHGGGMRRHPLLPQPLRAETVTIDGETFELYDRRIHG